MKHTMGIFGIMAFSVMTLVCGLTPTPASAQKPKLTADQVMAKFVEATGGHAAYEKIKSTVMKGTLEITPQGLKGTFEASAKAPNLIFVVQKITGIGDTRQGYDGTVAWSKDPFNGLRILDGPEAAEMKREATFNAPLHWKELYKSAQMLGIKQMDGKEVYAIKLTPEIGKPQTQYYDTKTFYLVGSDSVQQSPQGEVPVHVVMSDYRTVDGVKEPFTVRQKLGPAEVILKTTEIKNNVALDSSLFAKPAEAPSK